MIHLKSAASGTVLWHLPNTKGQTLMFFEQFDCKQVSLYPLSLYKTLFLSSFLWIIKHFSIIFLVCKYNTLFTFVVNFFILLYVVFSFSNQNCLCLLRVLVPIAIWSADKHFLLLFIDFVATFCCFSIVVLTLYRLNKPSGEIKVQLSYYIQW